MQKETFVTLINGIIKQVELENDLSKSISVCFAEPVLFNVSHKFVSKIIDSLANEFNDEPIDHYTMIDWWLYDSPSAADGVNKEYAWVEYDDKKFTLYDAGELYDFLKYKQEN